MATPATERRAPTTPSNPAAATTDPNPMSRARLLVVFLGLILGILMAVMDQTIVATAQTTIAADLDGLHQLAWIITSYLLAQTLMIPIYGKLGDVIGRKQAFQLAVLVFLAGSVLCGLAQSMGMLIAFRVIQGLGAGGLLVGAQTIMGSIVTPRERAKYMSVMGPMIGVGVVLGPLVGGYLTEYVSWHWLFYVNVPVGVLSLVIIGTALRLPHVRSHHSLDLAGAVLLSGAVICLVLLLNWGGSRVAWDSTTILGLAAAVAVLVPLFLLAETRAAEPVLPLHLFRDGVFRINAPLAFILGIAMFGAISFLPIFLQLSLGASSSQSGLLLLPLMGGLMTAAVTIGQIMSRTGRYKIFPLIGAPVAATGMFLLSLMDADTSRWTSSGYMLVLGVGIGLIMPMLILTVQNSVPDKDMGTATAGVNFFRQIGAALGVAVIGSLFTSRLIDQLAERLPAETSIGSGNQVRAITPETLDALPAPIARDVVVSYADALTPLFAYFAPALVLAFVLAWFLKEKPLTSVAGAGPDRDGGATSTDGADQGTTAEGTTAEGTTAEGTTSDTARASAPVTAYGLGLSAAVVVLSIGTWLVLAPFLLGDASGRDWDATTRVDVFTGLGVAVAAVLAAAMLVTALVRRARSASQPTGRDPVDIEARVGALSRELEVHLERCAPVNGHHPGSTNGAPQGWTLDGTVRCEGAPLAGAVVTLLDPSGDVVAKVASAGDGTYRVRGRGSGPHTVTAVTDGHHPVAAGLDPLDGRHLDRDLDLSVHAGVDGQADGTVVDFTLAASNE